MVYVVIMLKIAIPNKVILLETLIHVINVNKKDIGQEIVVKKIGHVLIVDKMGIMLKNVQQDRWLLFVCNVTVLDT